MEVVNLGKRLKIYVSPEELSSTPGCVEQMFGDGYEIDFCRERIVDAGQLIRRLQDKSGAILGQEPVTREVLEACRKIQVLSRFGVGYDKIDVHAATQQNVKVAITYGAASKAVAKHALALLFALSYNIKLYQTQICDGQWERRQNFVPRGKIFGIIGLGSVGVETALLAEQMGYEVAYYSRTEKEFARKKGYRFYCTIEELIDNADIVSLHLSGNDVTRNTLNAERVKHLKGKYFINTARADLVDENALYGMCSSGQIRGIGLDVLKEEPPKGVSAKLVQLPNVIVTPHVGCNDEESVRKMRQLSINNIKYVFSREPEKVRKFIN